MTDQLCKDNFRWTDLATAAFEQLKNTMVSPLVLVMPDFQQLCLGNRRLRLWEWSNLATKNSRPVTYFRKLLGVKAWRKSINEKELIAICLAVQKWKHYLLGRHYIVRSDQQSLRFLTWQREVNAYYQKWVTK